MGVLRTTGSCIFSNRMLQSCLGESRLNGAPASRVRLAEHFHEPLAELGALRAQHLPVEQHAVFFHAQQHRHQRLLALFIQRLERGHASKSAATAPGAGAA